MGDLYRRYHDAIYGYMLRALREDNAAQDATQQVFANALRALDSFEDREEGSFTVWLFTIARNVAIDVQRAGWRRRERPVTPHEVDLLREKASYEDIPGASWLSDSDLESLVERLPSAQKSVVVLHHAFDLPMERIAELLDRTPAAVGKLHERAIASLRERMTAIRARRERHGRRQAMRMRYKPARVIVNRRFALQEPRGAAAFYSPIQAYRRPF
jgi:RNA polymerase sigma-70 factor (ECF subfamily)